MSVVNHKHHYIFCHEPHTGGRAIEAALMSQHEGSQNFNGDHHISVTQMLDGGCVTAKQFDTYWKFRVVRNPYDWLVTCWLRNSKHTTFKTWVFNKGLKHKKRETLFWRYHERTNFNLAFENLEQNLNHRFLINNIPFVALDKVGVTENKPDWRTLLTVAQAKQLEVLYPDIHKYGYSIFT